jgi:chromosome condensin MukBEF complex kleisin-like MukF subunit
MYYEDHDRIVMENGDVLIKEGAGESVHTFVPLGHTFRTLNKIAFQNCYKISHYLLDETSDTNDEDRILMEDGISGILMEDVEATGLTISQLEEQLGNFYVQQLPLHERKRTNIAFSSYVNSSNITNSTLQSL